MSSGGWIHLGVSGIVDLLLFLTYLLGFFSYLSWDCCALGMGVFLSSRVPLRSGRWRVMVGDGW